MAEPRHKHDWQLLQERVVDGFVVADAHRCADCPTKKWSSEPGHAEEWLEVLRASGHIGSGVSE